MDLSTLTYGAPATEPAPIEPIRVDGMAYAKIPLTPMWRRPSPSLPRRRSIAT